MENSKILLDHAIYALSSTSIASNQWSIGGGTVLANYFNHRISKDIDVFINDAQCLTELSPRVNDECDNALDYDEMSNFISLTYLEGKVDFIVAPQITIFSPQMHNFFGRDVMLDDAVEIVAKKLYFRSDHILPRDLFDLAIVYSSDRHDDLVAFALTIPEKIKMFINNFERDKEILSFKAYSIVSWDAILNGGRDFVGKEIDICQRFIDELKSKIK
ncbi:MAG: nucleotidyl transferase AbiEii/AbiGii toxin family protein [Phascolarctobacterium sp.]|nr:nucleotidyl transferase AbiEii/AbiGii toxin family protein [Phascolarctobacterium sp.]